jgi:hypothetical protein
MAVSGFSRGGFFRVKGDGPRLLFGRELNTISIFPKHELADMHIYE